MDFELLFNVEIKGDGSKSGQQTRSSTNSSLGTSLATAQKKHVKTLGKPCENQSTPQPQTPTSQGLKLFH
jgi:hypothetical protein